MSNDNALKQNKLSYITVIITALMEIISTLVFVLIFAVVMYLIEGGYEYSSLFATVSIAIGALIASFYLGNKQGQKGILIGLAVGGITFITVTLLSLLMDNGAVGINILFHFIIIMLASLIGAILGVNKKANQKYI